MFCDKDPPVFDSFAKQIPSHVLAIDHHGISMRVEVTRHWKEQTMHRRAKAGPDTRPQDERFSPRASNGIGEGQDELAIDTFDVHVTVLLQQLEREGGRDSGFTRSETRQVFKVEISLAHAMLFQPILFIPLRVKVVADISVACQSLVRLDPAMRAIMRDKGYPRCSASGHSEKSLSG